MKNVNEPITSENIDQFLRELETERYKSALREAADKGSNLAFQEISGSDKKEVNQ